MNYFEYDEDNILVDVKSSAWKNNGEASLRQYMTKTLGYTDVKKDLEWIHIKETMMAVCHIRSLWTFSSRLYIAAKLGAYVRNNCQHIKDNRKLSHTAIENVISSLVPRLNTDLWGTYFDPMTENVGLKTPYLVEQCSNDDTLRHFSVEKFMQHVDSSTKNEDISISTCDHLSPRPTISPHPTTSAPSQK